MQVTICQDAEDLGATAAAAGATAIRSTIAARGAAHVLFATGASQFTVLASLIAEPDIAWDKVTGFHLDEYVGLPAAHPASFRRYLKERLVDQVPIGRFHYVDGQQDPQQACAELGKIIEQHPIDVAFVGIGENGHLAFNDPPADFETEQPFIMVQLDEACRRQQFGEGWFASPSDVPQQAISMSIRQIMKSKVIVCSVPDERKAVAVKHTLEGPVSNLVPASILQQHPAATLFLDRASASQLA